MKKNKKKFARKFGSLQEVLLLCSVITNVVKTLQNKIPQSGNGKKDNTMTKTWRSESLLPHEKRAFKKWVKQQRTKEEAAKTIGLSRQNLYNVLAKGSGRPATIEAIRKQLV